MFTVPSLGKILVVVAIVLAVWYGFKLVGHLDRKRKEAARLHRSGGARPRARTTQGSAVEDMVKCPACGSYVAGSGAAHCGRADCPART